MTRMAVYEIDIKVEGDLYGVKLDRLWECILAKRSYLELESKKSKQKKEPSKLPKILVLDLEIMGRVVQLFDELGIEKLDDHKLKRPLWSIANIDAAQFEGLPVTFSITDKLVDVRAQMLGEKPFVFSPMPKEVNAELRPYQVEGVHWLERLRLMYLNGILADDMGLGKTLQTIVALTQHHQKHDKPSLVICPTSLLYNWKEELHKFHPKFKTIVIDGVPTQRKKMIANVKD